MNKTEHKYYVYSLGGLLLNRVPFDDVISKYGEIVAISNNGLNLVLQKSPKDVQKDEEEDEENHEKIVEQLTTLHIFNITVFKMNFVKSINILKDIEEFYEHNERSDAAECVHEH